MKKGILGFLLILQGMVSMAAENKTKLIVGITVSGLGVEQILQAIVERVPHPEGFPNQPLQALIFDSEFNSFRPAISIMSNRECYVSITTKTGMISPNIFRVKMIWYFASSACSDKNPHA